MKAKFTKGLLSMILAIVMVVSMITVGIVNVSSAEVETADTGASVMEVYFTKPGNWGSVKLHYWGGDSSTSWPGIDMTYKETNSFGEKVYYNRIPANTTGIIFHNNSGTQSQDINVSGKQVVAYYMNGNNAVSWTEIPAPTVVDVVKYYLAIGSYTDLEITSGSQLITMTAGQHRYVVTKTVNGSQEGTYPNFYTFPSDGSYQVTLASNKSSCTFTKVEPAKVYFADNTDDKWIASDEATILVNGTAMTKTVDEHTGWTVWTANLGISNGVSLTYQRVSKLDNSNVWNSWTTTYDASNPCYVATGDTVGSNGTAPTIPAGTATDYWYGIWADPKGDGNVKDFVKIYSPDYYSNTSYYLYLPSYANRSALKIYTSLYDLKIGSVSVPRATATTVNLSSDNAYSLSFKRYTGGSTHSDFKLYVKKTSGVSALLLTTKADLFTGLTSAYALKQDGTPDFPLISQYKESTSTKGDYLCYDSAGTLLNPTDAETGKPVTGLKKIKGRGNSTFEASMRLFGKYAYNITLTEKAPLISGAVAQKKYSLLANNADETLLRNVTVYSIADEIGMPYTPNTRLIDLYDNGNYIGAYVLTEKVEYGKNTLIPDAKSLDKTNEDILAEGKGIDYDALEQTTATYTAKSGTTYQYQYSYNPSGPAYEFDGTVVTIGEGEEAKTYTLDDKFMKKHDFLLEHELATRYAPEGTWFISDRTKQAVVPKYPEFATQKEVQWMIEEYDALETAVFAGNYATVKELADVTTFADVYLIQELTMNLDAAATSYNILGGGSYSKLMAAPLWDYDWAAGQYDGTKLTTDGEVNVSDTSKVFVKKKSVKIDSDDGRTQSIPNLQAKMTQMAEFWNACKIRWTNNFQPALNKYLGNSGILLTSYLSSFRSASDMNESRWNTLHTINAHPENYWCTKDTTQYSKGSNNFAVGSNKCTGASFNYNNTVYYLNDWLTARRSTMSNTMGLYDASLIGQTVEPTEPPTAPPTEPPTTPPTEPPTTPPTEPTVTYVVGDANGSGSIDIMDATTIQRKIAGLSVSTGFNQKAADANRNGNVDILDATVVQRYIAGLDHNSPVGQTMSE